LSAGDDARHAASKGADSPTGFETALMAKVLACLFAAGAVLAFLTVLLPHPSGASEPGLVSVVIIASAVAGALFFAADRVRPPLLPLALALGTTLITALTHFFGESPSPFTFFYLWVFLYSSYFFSRVQAALQIAYVAAAYTGLLVLEPPSTNPATWWLVATSTLVVAAGLIMTMRSRAELLIERLHDAERLAHGSQTRLQSILDHLPLAIYLRDLDDRYQVVNAKFATELGLPADQIIGMTAQQLHPEALNEWARELERPIRERGEAVAGESAAPHADGTEHYHWVIKYPVNDENGALTAIGGAILDITDRRRAELAVAEAEAEQAALRRVATSVAQGLGSAIVFAHVAEEVAVLLGVEMGVVLRYISDEEAIVLGSWTTDPSMRMPSPIKLDGTTATSLVASTGRTSRIEHYQSDAVIDSNATAGVAAPITIAGKLWGVVAVGVMNDVSLPPHAEQRLERFAALAGTAIGNAEARDALARLAATDELSGLANYRTFRDRLSMEGERAKRHGRPLSLVLLDVDSFKAINDEHGHGVGDSVLIEFACRLTAQVRDSDLVARVGGEEFALLLPETDAAGALATAERVREAVEQGPFAIVGRVTVSVGVCSLEESGGSADSLVLLADTALYWAKNSGRNVTFCYSDAACAAFDAPAG
jgi:diguanylate cyclase (GGDEF)-like protein/PAS domain S-box-containing protein